MADNATGPAKPAAKPETTKPVVTEPEPAPKGAPHIKGRVGFDNEKSGGPVDLVQAAKDAAPSLTDEIIDGFDLSDDDLADIASGAQPAPPVQGPIHTVDQYLTPAGFVSVPAGVDPSEKPSAGSR
jgi:hypothetical protein